MLTCNLGLKNPTRLAMQLISANVCQLSCLPHTPIDGNKGIARVAHIYTGVDVLFFTAESMTRYVAWIHEKNC